MSAELGSSNRKKRAVAGQRAGDLDPLAHGQRAVGQRAVGVVLDLQLGAAAARSPSGRAGNARTGALATDHQVLGDRQVGPQLRLLVDHRDAVARVTR